jgi:hypothetical protein
MAWTSAAGGGCSASVGNTLQHPSHWLPARHSCDPNAWLVDGLDLAARRGIGAGEQVRYLSCPGMVWHGLACMHAQLGGACISLQVVGVGAGCHDALLVTSPLEPPDLQWSGHVLNQITLDFGSLVAGSGRDGAAEALASHPCRCGSAACRGVVTSEDYLKLDKVRCTRLQEQCYGACLAWLCLVLDVVVENATAAT